MKKSLGFTLIEILVVVSIIGILAALLLANMVGIRERAADTRVKNNAAQLKNALRLYYNDNQTYPASSGTDPCDTTLSGILANYISSDLIPTGNDCRYGRTNTGDGFIACVVLQNNGGIEDDTSRSSCNATAGFMEVSTEVFESTFCVCAN